MNKNTDLNNNVTDLNNHVTDLEELNNKLTEKVEFVTFDTQDDIREYLMDGGYINTVIFENPDFAPAFVGVDALSERAIYDYDLMVKSLMEEDSMMEEEAMEFIDYNTIRSLSYEENAPIVMHRIPDYY